MLDLDLHLRIQSREKVGAHNQLDSVSTVGGRLKAGPGGSYAEFIQAPRFEGDRHEKFDAILYTHKAWTLLLMETDLLTRGEAAEVFRTLRDLEQEGQAGLGPYLPELEDLYMHVERYLAARAGVDTVGKICRSMSRNVMPFSSLTTVTSFSSRPSVWADATDAKASARISRCTTRVLTMKPLLLYGSFLCL